MTEPTLPEVHLPFEIVCHECGQPQSRTTPYTPDSICAACHKPLANSHTPESWFEPKTGRFLANELATEIMDLHQFKTPCWKGTGQPVGELRYWTGKYWAPGGETLVREEAQRRLGTFSTVHRKNEVIDSIETATYCDIERFQPPLHLINLENGVYDRKTKTLLDHSPDYWFTHVLPIKYDPAATCPNFDRFLEEVQPGKTREKLRQLVWEHIGDMFHRLICYPVALLLVGFGKNGKSVLIQTIVALIGPENVSRRTIQQLSSNRFALADLYGKHLNAYADLPSNPLYDTSFFKTVVGGDPVQAERKNQQPFGYSPTAKWIISTNQVPRTDDQSDAYHRRFDIIDFQEFFEDKPEDPAKMDPQVKYADPNLVAKLTTPEELSGMFNKAMAALDDLEKRGSFCVHKTIQERREEYTRLSNPVACFVEDRLEITQDDADWIEKGELYDEFKAYLSKHHYSLISDRAFAKQLRNDYPVSESRHKEKEEGETLRNLRVWKGIRLVPERLEPLGP